MSLFKKHWLAQAELQKRAEDEADDEKEFEVEAETEDDEEGLEKEAEADDDVDEIGDAVESEVEDVVDEVKEALIKTKAQPHVIAAVCNALNYNGVLISNPVAGKVKSAKFSKAEKLFVQKTVNAATEAVEEILRAAHKAMIKRGCTKKQAKLLDQKLFADGYLRSCVATPEKRGATERKAKAVAKRKASKKNVLGLQK